MVGDASGAPHLARPAPVVVVLHTAAHVVRRRHVVADVVEETDRQIRIEVPGLRHVVRRCETAVVADDDVVRVARVDPDGVDVVVDRLCDVGGDRLAAVQSLVQADATQIDDLGIVRIDPNLTEIHRPRVGVVDLPPGRAAVVGSIESRRLSVQRLRRTATSAALGCGRRTSGAFLPSRGRACSGASATRRHGSLDQRVEDVRALPIDVHGDSSERSFRNPAFEARPRLATIRRPPETAARTATVHATGRPASLIGRGVQHLTVRGIHCQIVRARVVVDLQHLLPRFAAIRGLVHAAFPACAEERARGCDEHRVVGARVDDDAIDVTGGAKPDIRVCLPTVRRFVNAVAPRRTLAVVRLAGPDPDEIRVALGDRDVADGHQSLSLQLRLECRAVVDGLPHAAVRGSHVEDCGIGLIDREIRNAAGHRCRADRTEMKRVEYAARRRRCGGLVGSTEKGLARQSQHEGHTGPDDAIPPHTNSLLLRSGLGFTCVGVGRALQTPPGRA
jgi:hypothetical protein